MNVALPSWLKKGILPIDEEKHIYKNLILCYLFNDKDFCSSPFDVLNQIKKKDLAQYVGLYVSFVICFNYEQFSISLQASSFHNSLWFRHPYFLFIPRIQITGIDTMQMAICTGIILKSSVSQDFGSLCFFCTENCVVIFVKAVFCCLPYVRVYI